MADMKGKVIRIDRNRMVVLTDEGDFLNKPVPAVRPNPGDIVDIFDEPAKRFSVSLWMRAAVAVLVLGISLVLARPFVLPQAVAAVSMDLASSVELTINKANMVLEVKANNEQGEAVLRELDIIGMDIYEAANLVTAKAVELGYLQAVEESPILVTVAPLTKSGTLAVNRERLQQGMHDELIKQNYEGYLVVNQGPGEVAQEAAKMGLTVNQYMVWKQYQAQAQAAPVDIQEFKDESVGKIISNNETNLNMMFPGMWCRVSRMRGLSPVSAPAAPDAPAVTDSTGSPAAQQGSESAGVSTPASPEVDITSPMMQNMRGFGPGARYEGQAGPGSWMGSGSPGMWSRQ